MADDDQKTENSDKSEDQKDQKSSESDTSETPVDRHSESSESSENKPSVDLSASAQKIVEQVEKLSVLELSQLVKALEEKFGVSASPTVVTGASGSAGGAAADDGASEQTTFNVVLAESGANKISVIKVVRELVPTLGLKEAKDLVDAPPKNVLEGVNKEAANEAKTKLEAAGAKVELK